MVSLWTCSKTCEIFFNVGIVTGFVVGYELKTRVRRWLLNWLKDD